MVEGKKYYGVPEWSFVFIVLLISFAQAFWIPFDFGHSNIHMFITFDWIFIIFLLILNVALLLEAILIKMRKSYIYYNDKKLYVVSPYGKTKSVDLHNDYKCKQNKDKIQSIAIINNSNGKVAISLSGSYEVSLEDILALLESHRQKTSE